MSRVIVIGKCVLYRGGNFTGSAAPPHASELQAVSEPSPSEAGATDSPQFPSASQYSAVRPSDCSTTKNSIFPQRSHSKATRRPSLSLLGHVCISQSLLNPRKSTFTCTPKDGFPPWVAPNNAGREEQPLNHNAPPRTPVDGWSPSEVADTSATKRLLVRHPELHGLTDLWTWTCSFCHALL